MLHRVIMHICLSVIRIFALKIFLGKFIDDLMFLLPMKHKILTTLLLLVLVCVNQKLTILYL